MIYEIDRPDQRRYLVKCDRCGRFIPYGRTYENINGRISIGVNIYSGTHTCEGLLHSGSVRLNENVIRDSSKIIFSDEIETNAILAVGKKRYIRLIMAE